MYIGVELLTTRRLLDLEVAMSATVQTASRLTSNGELKKLLLELLPGQGYWTDEEYLWLTDHTNRLVEFTDGYIEVLPIPTDRHQSILEFLFLSFLGHVKPLGGKVHFAGIRLRIR